MTRAAVRAVRRCSRHWLKRCYSDSSSSSGVYRPTIQETTESALNRVSSQSAQESALDRTLKIPPRPRDQTDDFPSTSPQKPKSKYIILGAREARVLPRHRPIINRTAPNGKPKADIEDQQEQLAALDAQRKQLLEFKKESSLDRIIDTINTMRPRLSVLSPKRYDQIKLDLNRSFLVSQLREYLKSMGQKVSGTKAEVVTRLLKSAWGLNVSHNVSEASDVIIERTLALNSKQLFLIMAADGKLPRYWTRSGARIAVLSDERKLVIRATKDIYDWISASLHRNLSSIKEAKIDLSAVWPDSASFDVSTLPLAQIQQLSDTYLSYDPKSHSMLASSMFDSRIDMARRLIVQSVNHVVGRSDEYTTIESAIPLNSTAPHYMDSGVMDNAALEWHQRSSNWSRRKLVKVKQTPTTHSLHSRIPDSQLTSPIRSRLTAMGLAKPSITYTATLGLILQDNAADKHTFLTNVPAILKRCAYLPLYEEQDILPQESSEPSTGTADAWEKLLDSDWIKNDEDDADIPISPIRVKETKLDDTHNDMVSMIQIKLVPSPFSADHGADNYKTMPPVELYFDIVNERCDTDSVRIVVAEQESNLYVADPSSPCDIKFAGTVARFLDPESQIGPDDDKEGRLHHFIAQAHLDVSGDRRLYVPPRVKLNIDGKDVEYMYQQLYYRSQSDFSYKDRVLQLAILEGGGVGGRRLEANLVADIDESVQDKAARLEELTAFVESAFDLSRSLADPM